MNRSLKGFLFFVTVSHLSILNPVHADFWSELEHYDRRITKVQLCINEGVAQIEESMSVIRGLTQELDHPDTQPEKKLLISQTIQAMTPKLEELFQIVNECHKREKDLKKLARSLITTRKTEIEKELQKLSEQRLSQTPIQPSVQPAAIAQASHPTGALSAPIPASVDTPHPISEPSSGSAVILAHTPSAASAAAGAGVSSRSQSEHYVQRILSAREPFQLTRALLKHHEFWPVDALEKDGFFFLLSQPIKKWGKLYAIMYTLCADGRFYPRLLYKSKSDGNWRSAPAADRDGVLWKSDYTRWGDDHTQKNWDYHYTQETKAIREISELLFKLEQSGTLDSEHDPADYFDADQLRREGILTYSQEIRFYQDHTAELMTLQMYPPGSNSRELTQAERLIRDSKSDSRESVTQSVRRQEVTPLKYYFQAVITTDQIGPQTPFPDPLTQSPIEEYRINHSLLSADRQADILVRVYEGRLDGRPVEMHIAQDRAKRVWIDRYCFKGTLTNSYGVLREVIDSGALTHKPLEYAVQVPEINKHYTPAFDDQYVDLTPLLSDLAPIARYKIKWQLTPLDIWIGPQLSRHRVN